MATVRATTSPSPSTTKFRADREARLLASALSASNRCSTPMKSSPTLVSSAISGPPVVLTSRTARARSPSRVAAITGSVASPT
jgi:hypothetical protein